MGAVNGGRTGNRLRRMAARACAGCPVGHPPVGALPADTGRGGVHTARVSPKQSTPARVPPRPTEAGTLRRERLLTRLAAVADARLRVLLGPAGSGKSVLLRQLAATAPEPLPVRAGDGGLLAGLGSALGCAPEVDAVLTAFDRLGREVTVLVDDAHRAPPR